MYNAHETFLSAFKQKPFVELLASSAEYKEYYKTRSASGKRAADAVVKLAEHHWDALQLAGSFFRQFKRALLLASSNNTPMSAYLPICVALRNELNDVLGDTAAFDAALGQHAGRDTAAQIRERFNMGGTPPAGTIKGLLDKYQLWCFMMDPFASMLCPTVLDTTELIDIQNDMLSWAVPDDDAALKLQLSQRCAAYLGHTGAYRSFFTNHSDPVIHLKTELRLSHVAKWMEVTGGQLARINFFNPYLSNDLLYTHVTSKLASIQAVGSMSVERVAKPLKHFILTNERNRLTEGKTELLLRGGMNLRFLHNINM